MPEHSMHSASEENLSGTLLSNAPKRAILVGIDLPDNNWPVEESLDELERLATTAGVACIERVTQRLARPHPGTLLGSGKLQEIADLVKFHDCDGIIFDLELTPRQHLKLESTLEAQVFDRTALILIIFGQRAHTKEGQLQERDVYRLNWHRLNTTYLVWRDNGHIFPVKRAACSSVARAKSRSRLTAACFVARRMHSKKSWKR